MIKAIVATDLRGGIGKDGRLPWPTLKSDMAHFRSLTYGSPLLMGRKTWESIGSKNLPGRSSVVFSRSAPTQSDLWQFGHHGNTWADSELVTWWTTRDPVSHVEDLLRYSPEVTRWVIGGAQIFEQLAPWVSEWHVTTVQREYEADTYLDLRPLLDMRYGPTPVRHFEATETEPAIQISVYRGIRYPFERAEIDDGLYADFSEEQK